MWTKQMKWIILGPHNNENKYYIYILYIYMYVLIFGIYPNSKITHYEIWFIYDLMCISMDAQIILTYYSYVFMCLYIQGSPICLYIFSYIQQWWFIASVNHIINTILNNVWPWSTRMCFRNQKTIPYVGKWREDHRLIKSKLTTGNAGNSLLLNMAQS
jgi:hypothetical protein